MLALIFLMMGSALAGLGAAAAFRQAYMVLPKAALAGFNAFPREWRRRDNHRLRSALGPLDMVLSILFLVSLWDREVAIGIEWRLLWVLPGLAAWFAFAVAAAPIRTRLRLAFNRMAYRELRRVERTLGLLWLFKFCIGLRLLFLASLAA